MAEENATTTEGEGAQAAQPSVDELMAQVRALTDERDKAVAESRKWEGRSKSNSEKAKKYDELAAQSMNDAERADAEKARADEAEAKLAQYEADAQFAKDAAEVSEKYGVPRRCSPSATAPRWSFRRRPSRRSPPTSPPRTSSRRTAPSPVSPPQTPRSSSPTGSSRSPTKGGLNGTVPHQD